MPTTQPTPPDRPATDVEPHPWGAPLPVGHPGHRPLWQLRLAAFRRWLAYVTLLALAATVMIVVAIAAAQRIDHNTDTVPAGTLGHGTAATEVRP